MPNPQSVLQRSFAGGELSPALSARADLAQYLAGLKTCRNFIVQRHGGVANRTGLRMIHECKTTSAIVKILRYVHETPGESLLIEAGVNYLRFYQHGALLTISTPADAYDNGQDYVIGDLVLSGGATYYCVKDTVGHAPPNATYWAALPVDSVSGEPILEIPTPFASADLFNWSQSGRTLTLTQRGVAPHELIFVALTRWVFRAVDTAPLVTAPTNLVLTPPGVGLRKFAYIVTGAAPGSYEESEHSNVAVALTCLAPTPDAPHVLDWDELLVPLVTGVTAPEYYVYCDPYDNGTFGFIGTATAQHSFKNPGIDPDFTLTPPLARILFTATNEFPHVSATFQQRRIFAQTNEVPDGVWASRVGFPSNFGIASPLQDDDAITFRIAGNDQHPVRHLVPLKVGLVMLTDGGEWTAQGPDGHAIIPNGIQVDQATYVGAAGDVRPAPVGNAIIYVQARGSLVHDLKFDIQVEGLAGRDLTIFAGHLFDGFTIDALDYARTPHSIVWCVRSDGQLLGLTYIQEQTVWGWHRHDTAGRFEDVCVVPAPGEDQPYFIVSRTIGGTTRRFIERLEPRTIVNWNLDSFFLDCGLTYSGAATASVGGLDHLNGQLVGAVGDGVYLGVFTVSGGSITLPSAASIIHVGLLQPGVEIETLDLDVNATNVRDRVKRVNGLTLLLDNSRTSASVGPDATHLTQLRRAINDPTGVAFSGPIELNTISTFNKTGRILVRHAEPLPMTILGVIPNVEIGG